MTAQLDLLAPPAPPWKQVAATVHPPLARVSDPETSHLAAASQVDNAQWQDEKIESYYAGLGPHGAAFFEAGAGLGWDPIVVARRLAEIREARWLFTLVERRRGDGHGLSHVWVHVKFRSSYTASEVLYEAGAVAQKRRRAPQPDAARKAG